MEGIGGPEVFAELGAATAKSVEASGDLVEAFDLVRAYVAGEMGEVDFAPVVEVESQFVGDAGELGEVIELSVSGCGQELERLQGAFADPGKVRAAAAHLGMLCR